MRYTVTPKFTADFFHVVRLLVDQAQATAAAIDHNAPRMPGLCFGQDSDNLRRFAEQVAMMAPEIEDAMADTPDLDAPHILPEDFAV